MVSFNNPNFSGRRFSVKSRKRVVKVPRIPYKKSRIIVQPYMRPAAKNLMNSMMLKPGERVAIFPDAKALGFANALSAEITRRGGTARIIVLKPEHDSLGGVLPKRIESALKTSDASIYLGSARTTKTEQISDWIVEEIQRENLTRHISIGEISEELIKRALVVNPKPMRHLTHAVYDSVRKARTITVTSPSGTKLTIDINPQYATWAADTDIVKKGRFINWPEGEVFTAPYNVNGTLIVNGIVDVFNSVSTKNTPLKMQIKNGKILFDSVKCADERIKQEFLRRIGKENGCRIGEFSLPTNIWLPEMKIPSALVNEKKYVAIAPGDPLFYDTGCKAYKSETHIDMTIPNANVLVDGKPFIVNGGYVKEIWKQFARQR